MKFDWYEFSLANVTRTTSPTGFGHSLDSWSLSDWMVALTGEIGEASNVLKKLNRCRDSVRGNKMNEAKLLHQFKDELADVFIYLDLLAQRAGIDLPAAVVDKFNEKSAEICYRPRFGVVRSDEDG